MKTNLLALAVLVLTTGACSQHWREGDAGIDRDTMLNQLDGFLGLNGDTSATGSGNTSGIAALRNDPGTLIYYSRGPGDLGPVASVAAVDFSLLGDTSGANESNISDVQIYFLEGGSSAGLLIAIQQSGQTGYQTLAFTSDGPADVSGGTYSSTMHDQSGNTITLVSHDVDKNGGLYGVIQLLVNDQDGNRIGKFSTLVLP